MRGKKKETTESEKSEKAKKQSVRNRWLAGACCAAAMLAVGLPYLRQYQNVEEVVQTEGQSVAVTSEAQKAAEEPLLSPMATGTGSDTGYHPGESESTGERGNIGRSQYIAHPGIHAAGRKKGRTAGNS